MTREADSLEEARALLGVAELGLCVAEDLRNSRNASCEREKCQIPTSSLVNSGSWSPQSRVRIWRISCRHLHGIISIP